MKWWMGSRSTTRTTENLSRDGLTITVPGYEKATATADEERYRPLREKGVGVFAVEIAAATDAKPGAYELHVSDSTCSGNCQTNIRVIVLQAVEKL